MLRVTLDTNVLPADDLIERTNGCDVEFAIVSVTAREVRDTSFEVSITPLQVVPERVVWDESNWDEGEWALESASTASTLDLENILAIISSGSFPKPDRRYALTEGQKQQLRDAMILEAHIREQRDVFVSNDQHAFMNNERRDKLEKASGTRIMTHREFINFLSIQSLRRG